RNLIPNGSGPGSINLAAGTTFTVNGGSALNLIAPSLNFAANSSVVTSGGAVSVLSTTGAASPLAITVEDGASATISTNGGAITIMPTSCVRNSPITTTLATNQPITFAHSAGASGSIATLNLNGGSVFITTSGGSAAAVSINSGVSLAATGDLTATS